MSACVRACVRACVWCVRVGVCGMSVVSEVGGLWFRIIVQCTSHMCHDCHLCHDCHSAKPLVILLQYEGVFVECRI